MDRFRIFFKIENLRLVLFLSLFEVGCTPRFLDSWIDLNSTTSPVISGSVLSLNTQASGSQSILSCSSSTASLYQLSSLGVIVQPAVASTAVQSDGTYSFSNLQGLGVQVSNGQVVGNYIVLVTGCENYYTRLVTGLQNQDISFGTSLIGYLLNTTSAQKAVTANPLAVAQLLVALNQYSSYSAAYSALSTDESLGAQFQNIFGVAPTVLLDASPVIVSLTIPSQATDGENLTLQILASHWSPSYNFAYVWKFDGLSIGTASEITYGLGAGVTGQHLISIYYGEQNNSAVLDQTKPFGHQDITIAIGADTGPDLTITSPAQNTVAQNSIVMSGTCESALNIQFSGVGLLSPITVLCATGNYAQTLYFAASDGTKNIVVTQTDEAGDITTVSRNFIRDTTPPAITQTTLSSPAYSNQNTVTFGGACETGLSIQISGSDSGSTACSAGAWSFTSGVKTTDSTYTDTFTQTDAAGNVGSVSASWIRKTTVPTLAFTSQSGWITSSNTVTFTGTCVSGLTVNVSGDSTSSFVCTGGLWSYPVNSSSDGTFSYTFSETDLAQNTKTITGTWQRSTVGPVVTIAQSSPLTNEANSISLSGTCLSSAGNVVVSGTDTASIACTSGAWSYTPVTQTTDASRTYTFTQTDDLDRTSSASLTWIRDTTPPTLLSFSLNGGLSQTAVSYNNVTFTATDNLTTVTNFCVKEDSSAPLSTDACWYSVSGSETNVTPSNSVSVSGYEFNIGIIPQSYTIYIWAMDGNGNISTNTATAGVDTYTITLSPVAPPSVSTVLVSNSDTMNSQISERTISGGSTAYIRWTATGADIGTNAVQLFFTTDDQNWTSFATNLQNGINNCSSIKGSGSASTNATGCYLWSNGTPTSNYHRIRVAVTNTVGETTFADSLPLNAANFNILAGNTEAGLNGAAASAVFQNDTSQPSVPDGESLVVSSNGTIYFRDVTNGIVYVSPANGILKQLIGLGATTSGQGDGGSVTNAKLRLPSDMTIDSNNHLIVRDYDRIRKIDLNQNPPTINTIIGGGNDTSDTIANPLNMSISPVTEYTNKFTTAQIKVLPNGNIWFFSEGDYGGGFTYSRFRIYNATTNSISSVSMNGGPFSVTQFGIDNIVANAGSGYCNDVRFDLSYNPTSSTVTNLFTWMMAQSFCTTAATDNWYWVYVALNPTSGLVNSSSFPAIPGSSDDPQYSSSIDAKNGNIYRLYRNEGNIYSYNSSLNSWSVIAGNGTQGISCTDGSTATSCSLDPSTVFIDPNGIIYFSERGRIRTIANNKVYTLYGQAFGSGDGGLAVNARFANVTSVQQKTTSDFDVLDYGNYQFRNFSRSGTISTIAGNGSTNLSLYTTATTTGLQNDSATFALDSSNTIYYASSWTFLASLPASSGSSWSDLLDYGYGSAAFYSPAANGTALANISTTLNLVVLGSNGQEILYNANNNDNTDKGFYGGIYEFNASTLINSFDLGPGPGGVYAGDSICADGTTLVSCVLPFFRGGSEVSSDVPSSAVWDSIRQRWLMLDTDQQTVRTFNSADTSISTATTLSGSANSIQFLAFNNTRYLYYCSATDHQIHLRNMDASTEVTLSWPIPSLSCTGFSLVYDTSTQSLIFPVIQNGLTAVAELLGVAPNLNGI